MHFFLRYFENRKHTLSQKRLWCMNYDGGRQWWCLYTNYYFMYIKMYACPVSLSHQSLLTPVDTMSVSQNSISRLNTMLSRLFKGTYLPSHILRFECKKKKKKKCAKNTIRWKQVKRIQITIPSKNNNSQKKSTVYLNVLILMHTEFFPGFGLFLSFNFKCDFTRVSLNLMTWTE